MKKFEMDCWEVYESFDRDSTHVAYVATEELANKIKNKSPNYRGIRKFNKVYIIFDMETEMEIYRKENLRKSGLSKLTTEERQALGLL